MSLLYLKANVLQDGTRHNSEKSESDTFTLVFFPIFIVWMFLCY